MRTARWVLSALVRWLLLAAVWAVLSGANPDYALYGVVSVTVCTAVSLTLLPPARGRGRLPRPWSSVVLIGWFLGQSVVGGVDVARRALTRTPDIEPAVLRAPLRLPEGGARMLALLMMNLMPGSMAQRVVQAEVDGHAGGEAGDAGAGGAGAGGVAGEFGMVELHTLSVELDPVSQWQRLESRVAAAAGLER